MSTKHRETSSAPPLQLSASCNLLVDVYIVTRTTIDVATSNPNKHSFIPTKLNRLHGDGYREGEDALEFLVSSGEQRAKGLLQ